MGNPKSVPITPFRASINGGDIFATVNKNPFARKLVLGGGIGTVYTTGTPANQVNNVRSSSLGGYKRLGGGVKNCI